MLGNVAFFVVCNSGGAVNFYIIILNVADTIVIIGCLLALLVLLLVILIIIAAVRGVRKKLLTRGYNVNDNGLK